MIIIIKNTFKPMIFKIMMMGKKILQILKKFSQNKKNGHRLKK